MRENDECNRGWADEASRAVKEGNRKNAGLGGASNWFIPEPVLCR